MKAGKSVLIYIKKSKVYNPERCNFRAFSPVFLCNVLYFPFPLFNFFPLTLIFFYSSGNSPYTLYLIFHNFFFKSLFAFWKALNRPPPDKIQCLAWIQFHTFYWNYLNIWALIFRTFRFNPLLHGRFSDPYFKALWEGLQLNFFLHMGIRYKKILGKEFLGMGCLKIFWVKGTKPQEKGGGVFSTHGE